MEPATLWSWVCTGLAGVATIIERAVTDHGPPPDYHADQMRISCDRIRRVIDRPPHDQLPAG